ncbi:hypothetical protein ACFE04_025240 [Oxalis oulophora]
MKNSKCLFLYVALFVSLLGPSLAHLKPENNPPPVLTSNPPSNSPNAPSHTPSKTPTSHSNPPTSSSNTPPKTPSSPSHTPPKTPSSPSNPPPQTPSSSSNSPPQTPSSSSNSPPQTPSSSSNPPPQTPSSSSNPPPQTPSSSSNSPPQTPSSSSNSPPQTPSSSSNPPPQTPSSSSSPPPQTPSSSSSSPPQTSSTPSDSPPQTPSSPSESPPQTPSASSSGNVQTNSTTSVKVNFSGSFKKVFAFGDSFTDTGNAYMSGGLQSFVTSVISQTFFGPTHKLTGQRFCNGKLVIDFLCEKLALPTLPPYKNASLNISVGVNFAISGSTALSTDFFANLKIGHNLMWESVPESFQTQIDWFNQFLTDSECKDKSADECKTQLTDSLFWFGEMAGNDYARIFGSSVPGHWVAEQAVSHVSKMLKTVLDRGAKFIVVQGLPPLGCCPLQMLLAPSTTHDPMGCSASANAMIQAHNELLQKELEGLRKEYSSSTIVYADYWAAFHHVIDNYKQFNFEEPFKACCGTGGGPLNFKLNTLCGALGTTTCKSPDSYINWDGVHFTEAMNGVVADLFINKGFCKPSFEDIIKAKQGIM